MTVSPFPRRAIHLDFHTMPGIHDIGRDFKAAEFARTLQEAGVEYITVFASCNLGFAYYPTKIGTRYPGLKVDLLGQMVAACHRLNIQVAAYFNAGLDHEHTLRHREWCKLDKDGKVYDFQQMGHFFRKPCLNTGYGPHLLAMVKEVLDQYPVDGIFLDCFNLSPCYGVECLDGMKKAGLNPLDDQQAQEFCERVTERFRQDVLKLVKVRRNNINLFFNGLPFRQQPTHLELEIMPPSWGYNDPPWMIRYARTLGKPYLTMTGRFHKGWGDFGGIRPEHSLRFDCYHSIAHGGGCSIGDHLHPRGRLETPVYELIGNAYAKLRQFDPWTAGARSLTEMVIVEPQVQRFPVPADKAWISNLAGATRMLSELKYQFDVSDGAGDLSKYKVVLLPDNVPVTVELKEKLRKHLKSGGILISSAWAGLNPEKTGFALPEYKLTYEGIEPNNPTFYVAVGEMARGLPKMPTTIYTPGAAIRARAGAQVLARLYRSYFNKGSWDGYHENLYTPPEKELGRPALTRFGNVLHFSFPIFTDYGDNAVVAHRQLLGNCLESVWPEPLVQVQGLPSFGQATVTRNSRGRMVHLLTYVPELRGKTMQIIEEPFPTRQVELRLRTDGAAVSRVYLAPSRTPVEFQVQGNYVVVTVPEVNGYQMVVFESHV